MEKRKTLLEKYGIPLCHLDFVYVEKCENAREMEKIVNILRSGEEGYFPDLMRCAEQKLQQLKPNSKLFRFEEQIRQSDALDAQELKPIYDWTHVIKTKDSAMSELKEDVAAMTADLPPMRKPGKIDMDKPEVEPKTTPKSAQPTIKSTDYGKWDKYDADVELLRMDLEEERAKEQVERKNRLNVAPSHVQICEIGAEEQRMQAQLKKLSQLEREEYAEKYRLRGNEYFRDKEYECAIAEYSRAIAYDPPHAARAFNNRAVSHMKLKNYVAAIDDCEACLKLEPCNLKARLRLADATNAQGKRRESCALYQRVLELEPNNESAMKALEDLRTQLGELPPAHATRLAIEEHKTEPKVSLAQKPKKAAPAPAKEYDLAELIKPNRVVKSKLVNAAEALGKMQGNVSATSQRPQPETKAPLLRLSANPTNDKLLIQEI